MNPTVTKICAEIEKLDVASVRLIEAFANDCKWKKESLAKQELEQSLRALSFDGEVVE